MNINKIKIISLFVMMTNLLLVSCKNDEIELNEKIFFFDKFSQENKIVFEELYEYKKGSPKGLHLVDSILIIHNGNRGQEFFFYNYSLRKKQLSKGYLRKGRGPGEAIGVVSAGVKNNNFWVHDVTLKKILTIDKNEILRENNKALKFKEYPIKDDMYRIDFSNNFNYLSVANSSSDYKVVEKELVSDKTINEFGKFKNIPKDKPVISVKDAYTSYIYSRPSGGKLVIPYRYTDVIEIYDLKKHSNFAVQGPEKFNVDFKIGERNGNYYMKKTKKTRKAFVNGAVTEKYIYMLYSGHKKSDGNWSYGKYIYVYDWDGKPIKKITLDRYIYTFSISENDEMIYSYDLKKGYIVEASIK
jgi:cytochrome b involved in lipid metabolism